jgi:hypothetical protein
MELVAISAQNSHLFFSYIHDDYREGYIPAYMTDAECGGK